MKTEHATRKVHSAADSGVETGLSASEAVWLRRGQRLGERLLTSRKNAAYGWATALMLAGGSLIVLALLGPLERDMTAKISPDVVSGR